MLRARKQDFISIVDAGKKIEALINNALKLKNEARSRSGHIKSRPFRGKQVAMIFEKHSTRTRVSFEVACDHLGCNAIFLGSGELQLGRGESIEDTGIVLSRYVDCIVYRAFEDAAVRRLAAAASVPVINALDDMEHPCQALADMMTIKEKFGKYRGLKMAYVGDGNNVCNSLMLACAMLGMNFTAACPHGYEPPQSISQLAASISMDTKCRMEIIEDPKLAVKGADAIYTDVWTSMGQEKEANEREKVFSAYQVNRELVSGAKPGAIVMHCLPAHRGQEITADVIDGQQSVVFEQAENRLHTEKAVLLWLLKGSTR